MWPIFLGGGEHFFEVSLRGGKHFCVETEGGEASHSLVENCNSALLLTIVLYSRRKPPALCALSGFGALLHLVLQGAGTL